MSILCTEYGVLTIPPYRMRNESGKSTESGLEYAKELEGYFKPPAGSFALFHNDKEFGCGVHELLRNPDKL